MRTRITLAVAALLIALAALHAVSAQSGPSMAVQVAAQPLEDGVVEFGVLYGGERTLPKGRYLNVGTAPVNRWLVSTPVTLMSPVSSVASTGGLSESPDGGAALDGLWATEGFGSIPVELKVAVRLDYDGGIEFAIMSGNERLLPAGRFLSSSLRLESVGQWLSSTPVSIAFPQTPADLVRAFSTHVTADDEWPGRRETLEDVAAVCVLAEATEISASTITTTDAGDLNPPEGYPSFKWKVTNSSYWQSSPRWDAVLLMRDHPLGASSRSKLADGYLFIVRDPRPPNGTAWWAARFECASGETANNQSVGTGDGNGQLEPGP